MDYYGFVNENDDEIEIYLSRNNKLTFKIREEHQNDENSIFYYVDEDDIDKLIEALKTLRKSQLQAK